jgi:hypothetical protein
MNSEYSDNPVIRNRERAQDAQAGVEAYFKIKNPRSITMDVDAESFDTVVDLLTDLRHWANWRDEDFADAVSRSENHFIDEVAEETADEPTGGGQ